MKGCFSKYLRQPPTDPLSPPLLCSGGGGVVRCFLSERRGEQPVLLLGGGDRRQVKSQDPPRPGQGLGTGGAADRSWESRASARGEKGERDLASAKGAHAHRRSHHEEGRRRGRLGRGRALRSLAASAPRGVLGQLEFRAFRPRAHPHGDAKTLKPACRLCGSEMRGFTASGARARGQDPDSPSPPPPRPRRCSLLRPRCRRPVVARSKAVGWGF